MTTMTTMQKLMLAGVAIAGLSMTGCRHILRRHLQNDVHRGGHSAPRRSTTHRTTTVTTREVRPAPRPVRRRPVVVRETTTTESKPKKKVAPKPLTDLEKRHKKHKKGLKKLFR
jgi:hypothetical protein